MAYTISFTNAIENGTIVIEDGTTNQQTDLSFPGRQVTNYGQAIAENFLHLLENFASPTEPSNPVQGQLWYDSNASSPQLKIYNSTEFVAAGGLKKGDTQPEASASVTGDLWTDTDNQQLYLFTGSGWTLVGPQFSDGLATGATPERILGIDNLEHSIIRIEIDAVPVAIVSAEAFTPKTVIPGFSSLKTGINLSINTFGASGIPKLIGTAEKAENLLVGAETILASNFLRSDVISTTNNQFRIKNNSGLLVGSGGQLTVGVEGESAIIQHNTSGAAIDIRVNDDGVNKTVIKVDSSTNVGINNQNPAQALDVTGSIQISESIIVNGVTPSTTIGSGSIVTKGGMGVAQNLYVGGNLNVAGTTTFTDILPDGTLTRDIGSQLLKYRNAYANKFIGDVEGDVVGSLSGTATRANRLTSATSFLVSGDVTANPISFDGSTGGNTKTFTTSISNTFIGNKTTVTSGNFNDEFIINRITGASPGLKKINARTLLTLVPITPPGSIVPYAGVIPSDGRVLWNGGVWLVCDGREVDDELYSILFNVIGYNFKDSPSADKFALPDFRGRMPLGLDNMGGTAAGVVTGARASELGNRSGSEDVIIDLENLPEHEHTLQSDVEDGPVKQFFAMSADPKVTGDGTSPASSVPQPSSVDPTEATQGQGYPTSGGILADTTTIDGNTVKNLGTAIDVMNPFLAVNYIIFTGVIE